MPLSNAQYDEILREYQARQIKNQHIAAARVQEVYQKQPRLKEIDDSIASTSIESAKKLLEGDGSALSSLHEAIEAFHRERLEILDRLGYPHDYFTPPFQCRDCKDTGFLNDRTCHCFRQRAIDLVYTQSNIKAILKEENFNNFSFEYFSPDDKNPRTGRSSLETMKEAVDIARNYIKNFDQDFSNLLFYGDTGVGKTFLSNCIAKELLDSGHSVIYFTAFQLFDIFEKNAFHRDNDEDTISAHQNIFDCDLLIIDDLGTEKPGSFPISQLFLCLNERILRKKSTIISSNLSMNQIAEKYSERVFSRITSYYQLLPLFGVDIRLQKKLGR